MNRDEQFFDKWRHSKNFTGIMIAFSVSVITLAVGVTCAFIGMLFQGGDDGLRKCFFDTIFFESATAVDGTVSLSMGLTGDYFPFLFWFGTVFLFCFGVYYFTKYLLNYRQQLIDESKRG
ncbi:MAG: hypothetical protein LUE63_06320 [Lachnospiraceae bacterium]|nr:hypothetical protein [Lachnospiraceae bacterium]